MQFIGRRTQIIAALLAGPASFLVAHAATHGALLFSTLLYSVENWGG